MSDLRATSEQPLSNLKSLLCQSKSNLSDLSGHLPIATFSSLKNFPLFSSLRLLRLLRLLKESIEAGLWVSNLPFEVAQRLLSSDFSREVPHA